MADLTASLDGFNEDLLSRHRSVGIRASRVTAYITWGLVLTGVMASGYWGYREGIGQRALVVAASAVSEFVDRGSRPSATVVEGRPDRGIAVRDSVEDARGGVPVVDGDHSEARGRVLARLDHLEAAAVHRGEDRSQSLSDLARLRGEISKPVEKPVAVIGDRQLGKPDQAERETPIIVARPVPAPSVRQKPVVPVVETSREKKPVEPARVAVVETANGKSETDPSSIMLFRKREAVPVIDQAAAATRPSQPVQTVHPAAPTPASPPGRTVKAGIAERMPERVPEQPVAMRAPTLVVEEDGVRVVGPEGERFIPIGGKLNGKHILATSPRIGLIVTEDSAIRVNNQEHK